MSKNSDEQLARNYAARSSRGSALPRTTLADEEYDMLASAGTEAGKGDADRQEKAVAKEVKERRAPVCGRGRSNPKWDTSRDKHTSVVFNADQYLELADLAWEMKAPLKEVMYDCIAIGMAQIRAERAAKAEK